MKKFKFNLKLTAFLVSLFIGLLLVILGSKNKYCFSFGFIVIGISLIVLIGYNNEKIQNTITEIADELDEIDYFELKKEDSDEIDEDYEEKFDMEKEQEKAYVVRELTIAQSKLKKRKRRSAVLFAMCSLGLIFLGIFGLF